MIQAHNKNLWLSHTKKNAHKSLHTGNLSLHFVRPFSPYRPSLYWLLPHFFLLTCVWVLAVKWSLSLFHFPFFFFYHNFTIPPPTLLCYCLSSSNGVAPSASSWFLHNSKSAATCRNPAVVPDLQQTHHVCCYIQLVR